MAQWAGETSLGGPVSMSDSVSLVNDHLNPDRSYFKTNSLFWLFRESKTKDCKMSDNYLKA